MPRMAGVIFLIAAPLRLLPAGEDPFEGPTRIAVPNPLMAVAGDFDADGNQDVAVVAVPAATGQGVIVVALHDPSHRSLPRLLPEVPGVLAYFLLAADLDGDGSTDLVAAPAFNAVEVLISKRDGTFAPPNMLPGGAGARQVAAGDLNQDGAIDLVLVDNLSHLTAAFAGKGDGTFRLLWSIPGPRGNPHSVQTLDYDGDGILDIAVGAPDGVTSSGTAGMASSARFPRTAAWEEDDASSTGTSTATGWTTSAPARPAFEWGSRSEMGRFGPECSIPIPTWPSPRRT